MEQVITLDDVCALLHISVGTGRNRISRGDPMPPSFRTGRRRLFLVSEVDDWIRRQAGAQGDGVCDEWQPRATRGGRPRRAAGRLL